MSICVALDMEGVVMPELWQTIADYTGEAAFRRTTTEEADISILMDGRMAAAQKIGLTRAMMEAALRDVVPRSGAVEFLRETRSLWPTILVSDSFDDLIRIVSHKLLWPTAFCHSLQFDAEGRLIGYRLRQQEQKPKVVSALKSIGFRIMAAGDSLNDIGMLYAANAGALINAPTPIRQAHPSLPAFQDYSTLLTFFKVSAERISSGDPEMNNM